MLAWLALLLVPHATDLTSSPPATDTRGEATLSTALEYDSNVHRVADHVRADPHSAPTTDTSEPVVGDVLVRVGALGVVDTRLDDVTLHGDAALGLKFFTHVADERMAVLQAHGALTLPMPLEAQLVVSSSAKLRGQVSGARSYAWLRNDALLVRALVPELQVRAGVMGSGFAAFDNALVSSTTAALTGGLLWSPTSHEHVDVAVESGPRLFPNLAQSAQIGDPRVDWPSTLAVQVTTSRTVVITLGYTLTRNSTDTVGESFTRHRVHALVGFRAPGDVTVAARAAVQLTSYDDGISLDQRYFLNADEESQNLLDLTLSRAIVEGVVVQASVSFTGNELSQDTASYTRTTAALGVRGQW
jgi:hypothetical protein